MAATSFWADEHGQIWRRTRTTGPYERYTERGWVPGVPSTELRKLASTPSPSGPPDATQVVAQLDKKVWLVRGEPGPEGPIGVHVLVFNPSTGWPPRPGDAIPKLYLGGSSPGDGPPGFDRAGGDYWVPDASLAWDAITGKPDWFPPSGHQHLPADVIGLPAALDGKEPFAAPGTESQYWRGDKTWQVLDRAAVGLNRVDNTADLDKPVPSAVRLELDGKADQAVVAAAVESRAPLMHTHLLSDLTDIEASSAEINRVKGVTGPVQAQLDGKQPLLGYTAADAAARGVANGYAGLDGGGKVPISQLPSSVMEYQGTWDAATNTPPLADGHGNPGDTYRIVVGATRDLGAGPVLFRAGEQVMYSGTVWQTSGAIDAVTSVAGRIGDVVLGRGDVGLGAVDNTADAAKPVSAATQSALDAKVPTTRTVNGKPLTGPVVLTADDVGDGTTNKAYTAVDKTKLAGIETQADKTTAARVSAAGAQMSAALDTDVAGLVNTAGSATHAQVNAVAAASVQAWVIRFDPVTHAWPARPADPRPALFIGGVPPGDAPAGANMTVGDQWFPAVESGSLGVVSIPWASVTGRPATYPPSGHTHDAAAITSGTLALARLPVGGNEFSVCAGNDPRLSDPRPPTAAGQAADLSIVVFGAGTVRAAGTGDFPFGVKLQRAVTLTAVTYRCATADVSGGLAVELRRNGVAVAGGSATVAAADQVSGGGASGSWGFAAGDVVTVAVTAVGTTPGKGLIADIRGVTA